MDHRVHQQNAVDRSRYGGGFARRAAVGRGHGEGNGQHTYEISSSKIASVSWNGSPSEGHMLVSESWQSPSNKASGRPIKALIHEEMSREKKASRSSPSVIAKLMGLDSLPHPQMAAKQQKETRSSFLETPYASRKNHSVRTSSSEHQEFKDVFEIKDSMKIEKRKDRAILKGNSHMKNDDTDVSFIKEKFMEAKRLSTDGILQNSKEFNDAIEVLDSNKDLLLKFLEEPNYLFTKHLHDSKGFSPSPHESHITVLPSSKGKMSGVDEALAKSVVKTERCTPLQREAIGSSRKPTASRFNHLVKEHSGSLSHKLKSRYAGKSNASLRSTRIVVLKPNLEKTQGMSRDVSQPRPHENYPFGYRSHWGIQHSGFQELHAEGRERQNLVDNVDVMGQRTKGSREIAREIAKQMKRSVSSGSDKMLVSGLYRYIEDDNSYENPPVCMHNLNNSEAYQRTPDNFDLWNGSSSSTCSIESPMSIEARKRLCERWRMNNHIQEAMLVGRSTSTLGEMLAQSDGEVPRDIADSSSLQKVSNDKSVRGMMGKQFYPSGIGSRDRQKDEHFTKISRSSSSPSSSTAHGTSKPSRGRVSDGDSYMLKDVLNLGVDDSFGGNLNQRRSPSRKSSRFRNYVTHVNPAGEENKLPVREIHVNEEEQRNEIHGSNHSEVKPVLYELGNSSVAISSKHISNHSGVKHVLSELGDSSVARTSNHVDSPLFQEPMNEEVPPVNSERHLQQPTQKTEYSGINHIDEIIKDALPDHPQLDSVPSQSGGSEPESLITSKDDEQPSPVSVLENQSEEDDSSPECFERVSADLQGLRMQLQLLRLESDQYTTECDTMASSEDGIGECNCPSPKEKTLQTYRDDEDIDYSYLHDILSDLSVGGVQQNILLSTDGLSKHFVELDVYEKLEKKYGMLVGWPKSERKLLFDLVSAILSETLSPCLDHKNWRKVGFIGGCEGLVEEVWQMVVKLRKEGKREDKVLDPRWFDLRDNVDLMGRDIEEMLKDELLEELVSEFLLN